MLNLMAWRHRAQESHLDPPALIHLTECLNIFQRQIHLLYVIADNVLPTTARHTTRSSPVCRLRVELIEDSDRRRLSIQNNIPVKFIKHRYNRLWMIKPEFLWYSAHSFYVCTYLLRLAQFHYVYACIKWICRFKPIFSFIEMIYQCLYQTNSE